MKCMNCGTELEGNVAVCPFCGQAAPAAEPSQEQHDGRLLTKAEFGKLPAMKSCMSNINSCGIVLYILGVLNIALQIYMKNFPLDGIILILFGLGIHLGKSRICAVLCAAYGTFNLIYMIMTTGRVAGWWILLVAVDALIYTFKYRSAWNRYRKEGVLPTEKK